MFLRQIPIESRQRRHPSRPICRGKRAFENLAASCVSHTPARTNTRCLARLFFFAITPLIVGGFAFAEVPAKISAASVDTKLMRQLASPFHGVISGLTVREAYDSIAQSAQINYWLHPNVDPSRLIEIRESNWSVWDVLEKIADQAEAEVFPVAGVVVIGKRPWIEQFVKEHLLLSKIDLIDVDWPMLTTPQEAWEKVSRKKLDLPLAHDLWPAVRWKSIDRQVAMDLIDCRQKIDSKPVSSVRRSYLYFYPTGSWTDAAKVVDADAKISGPSRRANLATRSVETTLEGHRAIRVAWIKALAATDPGSSSSAKFSIRVSSRGGEVLQQLAAKNGSTLRWDVSIDQATKDQAVAFEAQDATLEEIARMVATRMQVELKVEKQAWSISPRSK
jgi:hypothetical protein